MEQWIIDLYDPNTLKSTIKILRRNLASNEKGMKFKELRCHWNTNSGRTALIMHLIKKSLLKLLFKILIACVYHLSWPIWKGKMMVGLFTNKVYVAGNGIHDLEMPTLIGVTEDVYDLNGNGSTTDKIPYAQSNCTIVAAEGIYARKYR